MILEAEIIGTNVKGLELLRPLQVGCLVLVDVDNKAEGILLDSHGNEILVQGIYDVIGEQYIPYELIRLRC